MRMLHFTFHLFQLLERKKNSWKSNFRNVRDRATNKVKLKLTRIMPESYS